MADIAVYTAVSANYDPLSPPPRVPDVDFIAFVDDPENTPANGWDLRPIPIIFHEGEIMDLSPRMRAKYPKLMPHQILPDYPVTVWVDGSHVFRSENAVAEMVDTLNDGSGFALHAHPWRDCIYEEAAASLELWKYASEPIEEQIACYRRNKHPEHGGLWACGSMIRRTDHPLVNRVMEAWWQECVDWTYQDQLSLPVVLRAFGLRPTAFPHHQVHGNPWFTIRAHPRNNE